MRSGAIIGAAIAFAIASSAQTCPPLPKEYLGLPFGEARLAIEENCARDLTQDEQLFVAGIAQTLLGDCKLPRKPDARGLVERFTKASTLAISFRKPDGPLHDTIQAMNGGAGAFGAGMSLMKDIRCRSPEAALLSRGIVKYLQRTSASSRFVAGCTAFYAGRYTGKQCQCVAETLRAALPDVDQRYFDREIIKESIHQTPFIALPLMFSCGIGNY